MSSEHTMVSSDYSDAGDTFASRLSNAADEDGAVSPGPHGSADDQCHKDAASRDFILKRFLPAAQAMTTPDKKADSDGLPLHRHMRCASSLRRPKFASSATTTRPRSFDSMASSRRKTQFIREVKQDVTGFSHGEVQDEERLGACGFPLHLRRLTDLLHFRTYSFWTSRSSSSRSKLDPQTTTTTTTTKPKVSEVIRDEASDNSDDIFWSDEDAFEDAMNHSMAPVRSMKERNHVESAMARSEMRELELVLPAPPARLMHSMETVHTPDHRGFLGVPKTSNTLKSGRGESVERARQVDRLGARLTRMLSKTNYVVPETSRNLDSHVHDQVGQIECEGGKFSSEQGSRPAPGAATKESSFPAQKTKWVDAVSSLQPPPSPKMPSESWLCNTLPPERLLIVKKLSRKPLGSFIPIKHSAVKPGSTSGPQIPTCEEESSLRNRQSCSLKEHLHGRQILSPPTMQAAV